MSNLNRIGQEMRKGMCGNLCVPLSKYILHQVDFYDRLSVKDRVPNFMRTVRFSRPYRSRIERKKDGLVDVVSTKGVLFQVVKNS
jgi:hypothetical protein